MRRLQKQFDETVNLGVLSGKEVLYLDFVETTQPLRMVVAPGESDPYYCTALGLAIASQWPDAALDRLLEETRINRRTTRTAKSRMAVMAKIRRTRELGYAEECGEAVEGVACLGLSLGALGYPAAALSIAIPLQRLAPRRKREIIAALLSLLANDPSSMR
jgi:IclR family acetate operon transcriptional repressor